MKKLLFISAFILFVSFSINAQIRWPFGNANSINGSTSYSNDTIDISGELTRGLNYLSSLDDTVTIINVTTVNTDWKTGDLLVIDFTEGDGSADTLRYGTNITGVETAIPATKTTIITFVFNGTAWVKQSEVQID